MSARKLADTAIEAGAAAPMVAEFLHLAMLFSLLELADAWLADHPYLSRDVH